MSIMSTDEWLDAAEDIIATRVSALTAKPGPSMRSWEIGASFVRVYAAAEGAVLGTFTSAPGRLGNTRLVRRYRVDRDELMTFVADVEAHFWPAPLAAVMAERPRARS